MCDKHSQAFTDMLAALGNTHAVLTMEKCYCHADYKCTRCIVLEQANRAMIVARKEMGESAD